MRLRSSDAQESFDTFEQEEGPSHTFKDCSTSQRQLLVASANRARNALAVAEAYVAGAYGRPGYMLGVVRRLLLEHFHTTEKRHLRDILANLLQLRMQFKKAFGSNAKRAARERRDTPELHSGSAAPALSTSASAAISISRTRWSPTKIASFS